MARETDIGRLMDENEAAERLTLSTAALRRWRTEGSGPPFYRLGRRVRYGERDLERWVKKQEGR